MTIERTRESVKDFYERRYAAAYMSGHRPLEVKRVRDVLSLIPPQAVRSVLDYGCGRGVWVPVLSEIFPGAGIAGTDISEAAVASAQASFRDVTFVVSDGSCAPWPDESFDLVFCYHVVEHVLDLNAFVADLSRLVKRGGWVCAITPCANEGSLERRVTEMVGGVQRSITGELRFAYEDSGHLRRLTTAEAVAAFGRGSLRLEEARFANHWWGTLEYMARSDAGSVRRFLGGRRARTKARLQLLHLLLLLLLGLHLGERAARTARLASPGRPWRRGLARGLTVVLRPTLSPFVSGMRALAEREWNQRRRQPGGSAQYLIFRAAGRAPVERRSSGSSASASLGWRRYASAE